MRTLIINYDRERLCEDRNATRTSDETNRERGLHDEENAMKTLNSDDEGRIFATKVINSPDTVNKNKTKKPRTSYWEHVERKFTNDERKMLVAESLAILCKIIMNHHVYSFGGKTYLQQGHGCIGDEAIGVIANMIMIWWSRKLKDKLKDLGIENKLLKIYVDDVNGIYKKTQSRD